MAKVEVGFCPVIGHVDLAMLIGAHGAGINVYVGVELLNGDGVAVAFQQASDRSGSKALAE